MSFYEELKRRNVAKVAVLYIIAAWLLLQVTDVLSSLLPVPGWAGSFVVMLLMLGFFPVMIFSWVYEMTPEGLKKEKDIDRSQSITPETGRKINTLIIVLLVLAIAAVVVDRLIPEAGRVTDIPVVENVDQHRTADPTQGSDENVTTVSERSIAVLPFVNMSSDEEQEYFSDGLSEELLNLLAKIPELQVAARTSSFSYKGKDTKIAKIGEELKVAHVLEGSVRKSGNQVRITAQLIQAEDGYHLWSETFDRTLDDVFAIQDEIAAEVVTQLKISLLGEVPKVEETNPEAYSLYLQALYYRYKLTPESYEQAVTLFEQALAIAPDYAAAWAGLGQVYTIQASNGLRTIEEGNRLARESAIKALAVDPAYAPTHALLGQLAISIDRDIAAAATHYERALQLEPTNLDILIAAVNVPRTLDRLDDGIAILEYLVARDPVNARVYVTLGHFYRYAGRLDESIASFATSLRLNPDGIGVHAAIGDVLLLKGEPEAGLAEIQQESSTWGPVNLPMAYHALGQLAESDAALAELIEKYEQDWAYNIAYVLAYRGETDRAFEWLDKAVLYNDPGLQDIASTHEFDNIHGDPRWLPFVESIGMSPDQLAAIEFEVTLPE